MPLFIRLLPTALTLLLTTTTAAAQTMLGFDYPSCMPSVSLASLLPELYQ